MIRLAGEFDESKHARADDGKFGSGGGGASTSDHESERAASDKIAANLAAGLDIGGTPGEIAQHEKAMHRVFGDKAPLDAHHVNALLGVPSDGSITARTTVSSDAPNRLKFTSDLSNANGDPAGKLERTFERHADGSVTAHHDFFVIYDDQKGKGIGGSIVRNQIDQYQKMGVNKIDTLAVLDGRYVWPKMGFEVSDPGEKRLMQRRWASYLQRKGRPHTPANSVQDIVAHPDGKAFLLGNRAPALTLSAAPATVKAKLDESAARKNRA